MATTPPTFELSGMDSTATGRTTLGVSIRTLTDTGTFEIGGFFAAAQGIYAVLSPPSDPYPETIAYQTDGNHLGSIHITALDTNARFVSGTFEFEAVYGSQTVAVTQGQFRGHYIKY
jgi:hypothetical protein